MTEVPLCSVAGLFKWQLNNLHFSAKCAKRLLGLVSRSFSASFPQVVNEAGSYSRLMESCISQLKAQGPSRPCSESKEEGEDEV